MNYKKNIKILLGDDDDDDREIFVEAMEEVDSTIVVVTVPDGVKLMRKLDVSLPFPDIIFLDLNMLIKNGLERLEEIRNNLNLLP